MKITPKRYTQGFCIVVLVLAIWRAASPSVAGKIDDVPVDTLDTLPAIAPVKAVPTQARPFTPHRIYSVSNYDKAFPDMNDVQLEAAQRLGVAPVDTRKEAEALKKKLVYIGADPYYHVEKANNSIPYLVPKAQLLLHDIGRNFFDSLQIKGVPLHKMIVTSVWRTREDIEKLQRHNTNSTTNSAHQYATTFDISYSKYITVEDPAGPKRRAVSDDTLKWVLSEVLNDMRNGGRCYVKYEKKQGCFHITAR